MKWHVVLSNRAEKNLRRVPAADHARLLAAIEAMCADPLRGDVVKLKGQAAFRRRVGNYRELTCGIGVHVRAQNGINSRLITLLLTEPFEQVRIKPHGHDLLAARQHDLGILPEFLVRAVDVGIGLDAFADLGVARTS